MLLVIQLIGVFGINYFTYKIQSLCNLRDRINNNCYVYRLKGSAIACASNCAANPACSKFIFSKDDNTCYISSGCSFTPTCSLFDPDLVLFASDFETVTEHATIETTQNLIETTQNHIETTQNFIETSQNFIETTQNFIETTQNPPENGGTTHDSNAMQCENGGVFSNGACQCDQSAGMVGSFCERNPTSCSELVSSGYPDGEYTVALDVIGDGSKLVQTQCTIGSGLVGRDLLRNSGNFDVIYDFDGYETGYFLGPNDFFIGLENMLPLLGSGMEVTFVIYYNSSSFHGPAWIKFTNLRLRKAGSSNYEFSQSMGSESRGNAIQPGTSNSGLAPNAEILETFFDSTFSVSVSCASGTNRGWWYNDFFGTCNGLNPLGLNYKTLPGATTKRHFQVPGASDANIKEAFDYFRVFYEES